MLSIATKRLALAAAIVLASNASAGNRPPKYLNEPVLGLRLDASLKLDPLPEDVRAMCSRLDPGAHTTERLWIFARASDAAATFYVVAGYAKLDYPVSGETLYEATVRGSLYIVTGNKCDGDPADESFAARDFNQTPLPILQQLSRDLAARLVRTLGGVDKLRAEIKNQRIDFDALSPELQEAFKPYFPAVAK